MKPSDPDRPSVILREHVYDGIEEFDQKLPNWWLFTLYIAIVAFVLVWVAYYQLPLGLLSSTERVERRMALIEARKQAELEATLATLNNETLREMSTDPGHTGSGKLIFESKCAACHGLELDAVLNGIKLPGVPLVDDVWIHGSEPLQIMHLVTNGSPDLTKGMIPWKSQLSASEIAQVVSYILSQKTH